MDGKPISAEDFLKRLFDVLKLPDLLESEERLRKMWSNPMTRIELLEKLEGAGCYKDDLEKLQELIGAEDSVYSMSWSMLLMLSHCFSCSKSKN